MSAKRRSATAPMWLAVSAAMLHVPGAHADGELPDAAFLEYLGSWEGTDDEWLLFVDESALGANDNGTETQPVPAGGESQEHDNED